MATSIFKVSPILRRERRHGVVELGGNGQDATQELFRPLPT